MTVFFRWQWMWRSRLRLVGIGVGAVAVGGAVVLFALLTPGPFNKAKGLTICGGVMLAGLRGHDPVARGAGVARRRPACTFWVEAQLGTESDTPVGAD